MRSTRRPLKLQRAEKALGTPLLPKVKELRALGLSWQRIADWLWQQTGIRVTGQHLSDTYRDLLEEDEDAEQPDEDAA